MNKYAENAQWANAQEHLLRAFAVDPDKRRLRFRPMKKHERAFIHALAEDFGLDSESMDPEPHRHVAIFKTPRFVMAPLKTLAEGLRIRQTQRGLTATPVKTATNEKKKTASNVVSDPFNAFLLTNARFGLTDTELRAAMQPILAANPNYHFDISFLPREGQVLVRPTTQDLPMRQPTSERAVEELLTTLKPAFARVITAQSLGKLQLCRVDDSLSITRSEADNAAGGWSQVAAKAASASRTLPSRPEPFAGTNSFTVLSTTAVQKRKQEEERKERERLRKEEEKRERDKRMSFEADAENDWWEAADREEEKERVAGSGEPQDEAKASNEAGVGVDAHEAGASTDVEAAN